MSRGTESFERSLVCGGSKVEREVHKAKAHY